MGVNLRPEKYLRYLHLPNLFASRRTKEILAVNPTVIPHREEPKEVRITVFDYDANNIEEVELKSVEEVFSYKGNGRVTWINIDGLRKTDIDLLAGHYNIHPLLVEDILSINQRPKMDEADENLFCLMNMLYFNNEGRVLEQEQISILLGKDYVISLQEDEFRDVFNPLRKQIRSSNSKIRQRGADYLCYSMLDMIVDNYFIVMEKLSEQIEEVEEDVIKGSNRRSLTTINLLRKELIVLKRNFAPVRELVNGVLRCDSDFIDEHTVKYFKDVYDHIVQAIDLGDNYRDIMTSMQDLYINNVNLKLNEVMKVMAIVTCLLAPATVIGGIFGMNFTTLPLMNNHRGFYWAVGFMLVIPIAMLWIFRRRGWFQRTG